MYQIASYETFQDGQIIFKEGDYGDWIYIIDSGSVELSKRIGDKKVVIEVLQKEDIFGEMAFIASIPRTATAQAIGQTTIGVLDRNYLDEEFNKLSGNFRTILKALVLRLKKATDTVTQFKVKS